MTITETALYGRISRKLRHDGLILHTAQMYRAGRERYEDSNLGRYYIVDANNHLRDSHVKLEELGRELGVLGPGEKLEA